MPPTVTEVLPLFSLKGRTAIISGAGVGIGFAVAEGLAEAGANVAIWYNSNKNAVEKAKGIEERFGVKCMGTSHPTAGHLHELVADREAINLQAELIVST